MLWRSCSPFLILRRTRACVAVVALCIAGLCFAAIAQGDDNTSEQVNLERVDHWLSQLPEPAQRGYRHLTNSIYLPADFDEEVFASLQRAITEKSPHSNPTNLPSELVPHELDKQRATAFHSYGLTERPGDPTDRPLQYVVDSQQRWVMNCFACHGGSVYGRTLPGAPNNLYQLQSLTEDVRSAKLRMGKPLTHMDVGSIFMPLGSTVGTTNAVMFGVALMNYRDAELNVHSLRPAPRMVHHDMDPPAWWLFHRKTRLYADGFAEKGARGLMQFMLVRENGPEQFKAWESDFTDVYAFIESIRPPKYSGTVDGPLADRGRLAFNAHCAQCHGTYAGAGATEPANYPERLIPIEEIGTDRVRLDSLTTQHRVNYGKSWFAHLGQQETWPDPQGYMAPPLDGIWASAPYLHNGSVPTLWHMLHPGQRPTVWTRSRIELDEHRVGLKVEELNELPSSITQRDRRLYFDTRAFGKSKVGHTFPDQLTEEERTAVLEYLKSI